MTGCGLSLCGTREGSNLLLRHGGDPGKFHTLVVQGGDLGLDDLLSVGAGKQKKHNQK